MTGGRPGGEPRPGLSVVVASFSGTDTLARCLDALSRQQGVSEPFEVVVATAPGETAREDLGGRFAGRLELVFAIAPPGADVFALRALGVRRARGRWIVLTEDHATADPGWLAAFLAAAAEAPAEDGILGGPVAVAPEARGYALALNLCEYGNCLPGTDESTTKAVSGINIAYPRQLLESCHAVWHEALRENEVDDALAAAGHRTRRVPAAVVTCRLAMTPGEAVAHLWAEGRHFGAYRKARASPGRRLLLTLAAPAVPVILLARLLRRVARRQGALLPRLPAALPALLLLLGAWSVGELAGHWGPAPATRRATEPGRVSS